MTRLTVTENTRLEIRTCRNRVTVIGWDDPHTVSCDAPMRQEGDTLVIEDAAKVYIRAPRTLPITLNDCRADVRLEDLSGTITLTNIHGDVTLHHLYGETRVANMHGGLVAKHVASLKGEDTWDGDVALREVTTFTADQIEGDVVVRGAKAVTLQGVDGNVVLEQVENAQINVVEGDMHLNEVGTVTFERIEGDLSARQLRDALSVAEVEGDVNLREVHGRAAIAQIAGDFIASNIRGALVLPAIEGDAILSFQQVAETTVHADGDVVMNVPSHTNAELEIHAPEGDIIVHADLQNRAEDETHLRGALGEGGVVLHIASRHGDVLVRRGEQPFGYASHAPRACMGAYARMGRRIAKEVRDSVRASLAEVGMGRRPPHWHKHRWHIGIGVDESETVSEKPKADKPRGPAPGSPERQAILDALARGELSVDDAIKKLRGE